MNKLLLVCLVVGVWWCRRPGAPDEMRVGVLGKGFVALSGGELTELDDAGEVLVRKQLSVKVDEARVMSDRSGALVGWRRGSNVFAARLDDEGRPRGDEPFATDVASLCEGTASNRYRWGFAWLDRAGRITKAENSLRAAELPEAASWCGIASANMNIAMLWRQHDGVWMTFCRTSDCDRVHVHALSEPSDEVLGFGCTGESCLFAVRAGSGASLRYVTEDLRYATWELDTRSPVSIAAIGVRAFAIGYLARDGRGVVERVLRDGSRSTVWEGGTVPPVVTWNDGQLLIARAPGDFTVMWAR